MMHSISDEYYERMDELATFENWDEQDDAVRLLTIAGEMLELMFGKTEATLTMSAIEQIVSKPVGARWSFASLLDDKVESDWSERWDKIEGWAHTSKPPFMQDLHELHAFSKLGIFPAWYHAGDAEALYNADTHLLQTIKDLSDVPAYVEKVCEKIDRLLELVPAVWRSNGAVANIEATRTRALARLKYDSGQPLTAQELAELSGVTLKRLQNAIYAKSQDAPRPMKDGLLPVDECTPWLQSRDYYPSLWKKIVALYPLQSDWGESQEYQSIEKPTNEDYVFVPVAGDGSEFTPDLKRPSPNHGKAAGFTIGAKGSEQWYEDYFEALEALHQLELPKWRRPNPESGNWGIVTGRDWLRRSRSALGAEGNA